MTKHIIMTSALNRTQVVIDGYVIVDMRYCAFLDGLPHGTLLISQRSDGTLYASRLLHGRLFGIDADEAATSAWIQAVESLMSDDCKNWLAKNAPDNYKVYFQNEYAAELAAYDDYIASLPVEAGW